MTDMMVLSNRESTMVLGSDDGEGITMQYGIDMLLKDINEEERCKEVLDRFIPGVRAAISTQPMAQNMSIRRLAGYSKGMIPDAALAEIDKALQAFNDGSLSPAEQRKIAAYKELAAADAARARATGHHTQDAIYPGQPWLDTNGNRIQAHAGQLLYENDTYYWYGENKEHTDGQSDIWSWGIRCYRSTDLYNWEDMGLIIAPNLEDPTSNLFPDMYVDRPHIVRCARTGKYVCWIKISGTTACYIVLQADQLTGPYTVVRENYRPFGYEVGDYDIAIDEATGKAYLFETANHDGVAGMELSEDYTSAVRDISLSYPDLKPPFTREGVTLFTHDGRRYLITSGMSGYIPNQSDSAVSDSWEQIFTPIGDPHVDDDSLASFNSQISQVFHVPNSDLYIALADRWLPDMLLDKESALRVRRVIAGSTSDTPVTEEDKREAMSLLAMSGEAVNTSVSDYVWLPVTFEEGRPLIHWHDSWRVSDLI